MTEISAAEAEFVADVADEDLLDEIFGMVFLEGADPATALRSCGVRPETVAERGFEEIRHLAQEPAGYLETRPIAFAVPLPGWSVVVGTWEVADRDRVTAASAGRRAVAVMRHDYAASHEFGYAVDGELITSFPPEATWRRHGSDPERLGADMAAVGLPLVDDYDEEPDRPIARALLLAARLTGRLPTRADLDRDLLSGDVAGKCRTPGLG
jgi:hypothetical protein